MRSRVLALALAALLAATVIAQTPQPAAAPPTIDPAAEAAKTARLAWFRDAKYGLFIHWGLYSIPAGEWKGRRSLGLGEWIMFRTPVPVKDYEQLASQFNPVKYNADEWVQIACDIKQIPNGSPLVGEEWISGPWAILSFTAALMDTLAKLDNGDDVLAGYRFGAAPGNRVSVEVSPHGTFDRLLFSGFRTEVWMRPGVTAAQARSGAGLAQRDPAHTAGVALVLGAGNIFSMAPLDTLQSPSLNFTSWMTFQSLSWMKKKFVTWPFRVRTISISLLL